MTRDDGDDGDLPSVVLRQKITQQLNPETCVAGFYAQEKLCGRKLVAEVEGGGSVNAAHQLQIAYNAFLLTL
jgi:hypothetical protein